MSIAACIVMADAARAADAPAPVDMTVAPAEKPGTKPTANGAVISHDDARVSSEVAFVAGGGAPLRPLAELP